MVRDASIDNYAYFTVVMVFVMAGAAISTGLWLLVTGRRNLKLPWPMIALGLGLGLLASIFDLLAG